MAGDRCASAPHPMLRRPSAANRLLVVTLEEQQSGFALRMAWAKLENRREAERRIDVALQITAITLFWLVSLALLIGWGMTGTAGGERDLAAMLAVLAPFLAAVIATRNGLVWLGGAYVMLTLVMIVPAMIVPAMGIAGLD